MSWLRTIFVYVKDFFYIRRKLAASKKKDPFIYH